MKELTWFKHYRGMVTDDKFEGYFEEYEEKAFAMIFMFSLILERATKDGGYFRKASDIPHDELSLRAVFRRVKEFYGADFIYDSIEKFKDDSLLETKDDGMLFVKNWEKYQAHDLSTGRVQKHRENKKFESQITEVINKFNEITGKNYRHTTSSFRTKIGARLAQGFSLEDCERVIAWKNQQWKNDAKMKRYITPDTLFQSGHFDRYLNEIPKDMGEVVVAADRLEVRDIFGNRKSISKRQYEEAEDGYFTIIN